MICCLLAANLLAALCSGHASDNEVKVASEMDYTEMMANIINLPQLTSVVRLCAMFNGDAGLITPKKKSKKTTKKIEPKAPPTISETSDLYKRLEDIFDRYDLDGSKSINSVEEFEQMTVNALVTMEIRCDFSEMQTYIKQATQKQPIELDLMQYVQWFNITFIEPPVESVVSDEIEVSVVTDEDEPASPSSPSSGITAEDMLAAWNRKLEVKKSYLHLWTAVFVETTNPRCCNKLLGYDSKLFPQSAVVETWETDCPGTLVSVPCLEKPC